jgi:hypothetical protein
MRSLRDRFDEKWCPEPNTGCWLWTAATNEKGYGLIGLGSRAEGIDKAHRVAFRLYRGPIPGDLDLLHSCDTPACVNPWHTRPGTNLENILDRCERGRTVTKQIAATHCVRGHEFTPDNTYRHRSGDGQTVRRVCRTCAIAKSRRRRIARVAA